MPQKLYALPCQRQGGTNAEIDLGLPWPGLAACAAILALAAPAWCDHQRHARRHRPPERRRPVAAAGLLGRHLALLLGTLISPDGFPHRRALRRGRTPGAGHVRPRLPGRRQTYTGTWHADPLYNQAQSDPHDIAVVVLDKPVKGITPASCPRPARCRSSRPAQQFTSVGYGAYEVTNDPGGHRSSTTTSAYVATGTLNAMNPPGCGSR